MLASSVMMFFYENSQLIVTVNCFRCLDALQGSEYFFEVFDDDYFMNLEVTRKKYTFRRVTRGGEGVVSPILFPKLEKCALILKENVLIVAIYGLNFSSKMLFLRVSKRKSPQFVPVGSFLFVL